MKSFSDEQPSNAPSAVTLRAVVPGDEQFLYEVYASTRMDELAQVAWSEAQREAFLKMQLNARDQSYRMHYPSLEDRIILFNDRDAGRLIVVHTDEEIRLADVAVLPEYRRAGIGTALVKDLVRKAQETGKPVRLQVERGNQQAKRLYERLGFTTTGETITHFQMEYQRKQSEREETADGRR